MLDGLTSPCYLCADRTQTCHDGCERYMEFRKRFDWLRAERNKQNIVSDYLGRSVFRHRHSNSEAIRKTLSQR